MRNTPIFVVGFGRSGTTLLQSLLGAHPRIAAPPEMHFARRIVQFQDYWGDLADDAVLRTVIAKTLDLPALAKSGFDLDRVYERAQRGPRTYAGVLDAVMGDFAERHGKQRWSEKTPLQGAPWVWAYFPEALVIHIIRDPRPTVASNVTKLGAWPDILSTARAWRRFTLRNVAAGAERGDRQYLRVRYEDLTSDPAAVMQLVFQFIGEEFDPTSVTDASRRRASIPEGSKPWQTRVLEPIKASPERDWRTQIPRVAQLRLAADVADLLPTFGYEPPSRGVFVAGTVLNAPFRLILLARDTRDRMRERRLKTPQQRYQAEQAAHRQRVRRMRRALQRSRKRNGSEG